MRRMPVHRALRSAGGVTFATRYRYLASLFAFSVGFGRDTLRSTGILEEDRMIPNRQEFQKNPNLRPKIVWALFATQLFLVRATAG